MSYDLYDVEDYAKKIAEQLSGEKSKEQENKLPIQITWHNHQNKVMYWQNNWNAVLYARSLQMAAAFLIKRGSTSAVTNEEQAFIDVHTAFLINTYSNSVNKEIFAPIVSPIDRGILSSDYYLNRAEVVDLDQPQKSAEQFRGTPAFTKLATYLTVLRNDKRNHSYVVKKDDYLDAFINTLYRQDSIIGLKNAFADFYKGKGKVGTAYSILNTGQDRTTRLFSRLGMRTTTIELIDNAALVLKEYDDQNSDSVDCCCF